MPRRRTTKEARDLARDLDLADSRARPAATRLYGVHVFDRPADERLSLVEALTICLDNRSAKPTIVTMVALTKKLPNDLHRPRPDLPRRRRALGYATPTRPLPVLGGRQMTTLVASFPS